MDIDQIVRQECPVVVQAGGVELEGSLCLPQEALGVVLFAHGSGSSRHSRRNKFVAAALREAGLGTLLFDLLTSVEEAEDTYNARLRFDITLLGRRLVAATDWLTRRSEIDGLRLGYFGASTGAAAALIAAVECSGVVEAVVSRGGRPDLAGPTVLPQVRAATLLIVGGLDHPVITINREALKRLTCEKEMAIVPGATHLFEEEGALEEVARLATRWFVKHLSLRGGR